MRCICNDETHEPALALWHTAYCHWFDADRAGHRLRAILWGWIADRLVRFA